MFAFSTLHKNWLLSLIFSPSGRDKREGAGCGSPFSAACYEARGASGGRILFLLDEVARLGFMSIVAK